MIFIFAFILRESLSIYLKIKNPFASLQKGNIIIRLGLN